MKHFVQYDFPAVIRAAKAHSSVERPVLCRLRGQTAIKEVGERDVPVAAIVKRKDGRSKFRLHEGRLFAPVASFDRIGNLTKRGERGEMSVWPLMAQRMFVEAASTLATYRDAEIWPNGTKSMLEDRFATPPEHEPSDRLVLKRGEWRDIARLPSTEDINFTENTKNDIEERLSFADRIMTEGLLVHNGAILANVPEPCLVVAPHRMSNAMGGCVRIMQGDISFYSQGSTMPSRYASRLGPYWRNLQDVCFPITEFDDALRTAEAIIDASAARLRSTLANSIEDVEIVDADAFTHDFQTAELLRLSDRVFYRTTCATRLPSKPKAFRKNLPEDLVEAILDFEAARNEEGYDLDRIEEAFQTMCSVMMDHRSKLRNIGLDADEVLGAISAGLERWEDRPVRIEAMGFIGPQGV